MTTLREAAQQALDALYDIDATGVPVGHIDLVIDTLKAALEQQEEGRMQFDVKTVVCVGCGGGNGLHRHDCPVARAALAQEQAEPVQEPEPGEYHGWVRREVLFDNGEPVGHREPVQEPVARECSDPMCACRGGPCAECEEGQREREIEDLRFSLDFYQRRCEALQAWQCKMRDPERTIVCDILANGFTLDAAFAGDRYTAPPQRKPLTDEEIDQAANNIFIDDPVQWWRKLARAVERKLEEKNGR